LTVTGAGVVTDQLSVVVDNGGQPIAHVVPTGAGVIPLPTTLVAALPDRAATVTVQVAALRDGVSIAWGATQALNVGAHQIVAATVQLGNTPPSSGITILPDTRFALININDELCVAAANGGKTNGTPVVQLACVMGAASDPSQVWQFLATDSGYYQVLNAASGLVMQVMGGDGATATFTKVELWQWNDQLSQQWRPLPAVNGGYTFTARHSGKCLDVPNRQDTPGLQLQQSDCNGSPAQSFQILKSK
jgi:glucosylceramidase